MYRSQLVDISKKDDIPPESKKDEYEYHPMPADLIPPVGPNLLMHLFEHPEDADDTRVLLSRMPKRLRTKLEVCQARGSSIGWGIQLVEGIDQLKLFTFGLAAFFVSLTFGIVWSLVRSDVQGGFAVSAYLFVFFTFTIGTLEAAFDV